MPTACLSKSHGTRRKHEKSPGTFSEGDGADTLEGNAGEDILIAGRTDHDGNYAALAAIIAEWGRTDMPNETYEARGAHLRGGQAGGLNGAYLLTLGPDGSIHDDAAVDKLGGSSARDLYFANISGGSGGVLDKVTGEANDEAIVDLL